MKKKPRRLWLNVKGKAPGSSREGFIQALLDSIDRGDYVLPDGWDVTLEWKNKESGPWKSGKWTEEMTDSSRSSDGWDAAVASWLKGKLR